MKSPRLYHLRGSEPAAHTPEPYQPATHLPTPLRELFEGHAPFVYRSLGYLGVPEAELAATLRAVFSIVFERLRDYERQEWVRAWLYSICVHVSRAYGHTAWRRTERVPDCEALAFGERVLSVLPQPQREAFLLYEVEDMSLAELAKALSCTPRTAYARLQAARTRIVAEVEHIAAQGEHDCR